MQRIGNFFSSVYWFFRTRLLQFIEESRVFLLFWKKKEFRKIDIALKKSYFFHNPYRMARKFLEDHQKQWQPYGETHLTTFFKIAKRAKISASDVVIEMGCGRGRGVFFLEAFFGCRVIGVDMVNEFISKATRIKEQYKKENVLFFCGDMMTFDLSKASLLYIYGTCLSDLEIHKIIGRILSSPNPMKIITVSYPLQEYSSSDNFSIVDHFEASYPWGKTDIYIQEKL